MNKVVNIYPVYPITTLNPPIRSTVRRVTKSDKEIRACLMARAKVEEVLPNNKTVQLDLSNYNKPNDDKQFDALMAKINRIEANKSKMANKHSSPEIKTVESKPEPVQEKTLEEMSEEELEAATAPEAVIDIDSIGM